MGKQLSAACQHKIDGVECGKPATAIVVVKIGGHFMMPLGADNGNLGRGTGSQHRPICDLHIGNYPDYDGQRI